MLSLPCASPCIPLSQCKPQAVRKRGRLHVIVFDKIAILSAERVSNCTHIQYVEEISKYFSMERSLAWSSRMESPPYNDNRPSGSLLWRTQIVFPTFHVHSRCGSFSQWSPLVKARCPATRVLPPECPWITLKCRKWLEELGFNNIETFSLVLLLLPEKKSNRYWPLRSTIELCLELFHDVVKSYCSIIFSRNWWIVSQ